MVTMTGHIHDARGDLPLLMSLSPSGSTLVRKFIYQTMVSGGASLFIFVLIAYRAYLILAVMLHYRKTVLYRNTVLPTFDI